MTAARLGPAESADPTVELLNNAPKWFGTGLLAWSSDLNQTRSSSL